MKNFIAIAFLIIAFLATNSIGYAQSYSTRQIYNQAASNSWTLFNQGKAFSNYAQSGYNYQYPSSVGGFSNFNLNTAAGWLNHPPITLYSPTSPMVINAGQSSTFNYWVIDPDADRLYSTSNFGSTGQYANGSFAWNFSPNFPGLYIVDTVVYDERGGFAAMRSPVYVKPWWSF